MIVITRPRSLLAALVMVVAADVGEAHEIGKTLVTATIAQGAYQVDVVVDPDALLTTLQASAGTTPVQPTTRVERDRRLVSLAPVFLDRITITFDGERAEPRLTYLPSSSLGDLAQAPSIVRLTGTLPIGARDFGFA